MGGKEGGGGGFEASGFLKFDQEDFLCATVLFNSCLFIAERYLL